jgi:signal transduction histidine kinase/streptogramin lyase
MGRIGITLVAWAMAASALSQPVVPATPPLSTYSKTVFPSGTDGLDDAYSMVQTSDGFVWFVGRRSVFRSDGVAFDDMEITDDRGAFDGVAQIFADDDDGIWVAYLREGVSLFKGGVLTRYGTDQGLPENKQVRAVIQNRGRVLAATLGGLYERKGERWVRSPSGEALAGQPVEAAVFDRAGQLWLLTPGAAYVQPKPNSPLEKLELPPNDSPMRGLVASANGTVWYYNNSGDNNLCRLARDTRAACWSVGGMSEPKSDRTGALWWVRTGQLVRMAATRDLDANDPNAIDMHSDTLDLLGAHVGLARDGSVWVMGTEGLICLRPPQLTAVHTPTGGLVGGSKGEVWLVSYTRGVMRVGPAGTSRARWWEGEDGTLWNDVALSAADRGKHTRVARDLETDEIAVLERPTAAIGAVRIDQDREGGMFVSRLVPMAVTHFVNGTSREVPLPPLDTGAVFRGLKRAPDGRLWLGIGRTAGPPLYRQDGARWTPYGGIVFPKKMAVNGFAFDPDGTLWVAAGTEGVFSATASKVRQYGRAEGLDVGLAGEIFPGNGRVWVAGTRGLAIQQGATFVMLTGIGDEHFEAVTGLVHLPNGDVWMAGADGITSITAKEWRSALTDPKYRVRFLRLDRFDGVNSSALMGPFPTAAQSGDGTLWFAMRSGLYRLRPAELTSALPPPHVVVGDVMVDGVRQPRHSQLQLEQGSHRLEVEFAAPGAEIPGRTRFQYRLARNGTWSSWADLGKRRQVTFEQIGYGNYALEIAASDRNGEWSSAPTQLAFRILPAFYQTWWFFLILTMALTLLVGLAYLARVRQVSARLQADMNARINERERIARDLHDTLLQGTQALLLSFQGIAARLGMHDPIRQRIESVLDRTENVLREGRDRVSLLRDPAASTLDLADCLRRHARDLAVEKGLLCEVAIPHPPRELDPLIYEELLQTGREAISNAFHHGQGTRVSIALVFDDPCVLLQVEDDGVGMPHDHAREPGHWGLQGMRERARVMGGTLTIEPRPEGGTQVRLQVPAARAYVGSEHGRLPLGRRAAASWHNVRTALSAWRPSGRASAGEKRRSHDH